MYQILLVIRFLTTRIMPIIAVLAVALCVTLVIVVVSVMTGFLDMLRDSGKRLVGDVIVHMPVVGFPYYRELIADIEALDEAEAATPVIENYGLLQMPYGPGGAGTTEQVQVWAIEPESLAKVLDYHRLIYWKAPTESEAAVLAQDDPRLDPGYDRWPAAMAMQRGGSEKPGAILGIEISPFNHRERDGSYRTHDHSRSAQDRAHWMPQYEVRLTVVPNSSTGAADKEVRAQLDIVNEFQTGVFQIDSHRIFIPLGFGQELFGMDEAPRYSLNEVGPDGSPKRIGSVPSRVTTILVKGAPGVSPEDLRNAVKAAFLRFESLKADDPEAARMPRGVEILTWEERMRDLIGPVEKERGLMQILFSLVYIVCAGLVLAIFWSIVHEKTRDIGVLRSVGASRSGILAIFLAYGLSVGVVGSVVGFGLASLIIHYINEIHTAIGQPAPLLLWASVFVLCGGAVIGAILSILRDSALFTLLWSVIAIILAGVAVLLMLHKGVLIWDPSVYYFSRIPNHVDMTNALSTMGFAVLFSVIGAAVPAARAADTDPVRSLRYE
ncbi:MAG: FtsX-like permease family protein [Phycisphaerae bacterium]|jgi:lipoprotein-releasing system permease protein|nr:FtsX-like permease family protein [Phycisphaerae bacterium]